MWKKPSKTTPSKDNDSSFWHSLLPHLYFLHFHCKVSMLSITIKVLQQKEIFRWWYGYVTFNITNFHYLLFETKINYAIFFTWKEIDVIPIERYQVCFLSNNYLVWNSVSTLSWLLLIVLRLHIPLLCVNFKTKASGILCKVLQEREPNGCIWSCFG